MNETNSGWTRRELLSEFGPGIAALSATGLLASDAMADGELKATGSGVPGDIIKQFLLEPGLAYMNNGSLGPCPSVVLQNTMKAWRELESNPVTLGYGPFIQKMEEVRGKSAQFIGADLAEMAITSCTTESMNMVAQGIGLQAGDHVLTTDHEHAGGSDCWRYFVRRGGVVVDKVKLPVLPAGADEIVELFKKAIEPKTKVISVSHVTHTTGLKLPIADLAGMAKSKGLLLVVDGAQAPGVLDIDVKSLNCDAYVTSAHKWMLAPKGTGLLYIRKEAQERIKPMALDRGYRTYTGAVGTRNIPTILGLGFAIDFLNAIGKQRVSAHAMALRKALYEKLSGLEGIRVVSTGMESLAAPLVSVELPADKRHSTIAKALLEKHKVVVKVASGPVRNGLRISTHVYNTGDDVARVCDALRVELA